MFQLLAVSHSGGSWTRNLLPDSWKDGSGGNSQYWGPGTGGDVGPTDFGFSASHFVCPIHTVQRGTMTEGEG